MPAKEWMLGLPGHNEVVTLDDVLLLVKGGALRPTDLVKKLGEPWRAANEVAELAPHFAPQGPSRSKAPRPEPPRESSRRTAPSPDRRTTARAETKVPSASDPASTKASDSRPPKPPGESTDVPKAAEPKPAETRGPSTRKVPVELPAPSTRPRPRLEPMVEKYFSPVDLLRCASYAFEPRKLLLALILAAPLALGLAFLMVGYGSGETWTQKVALAGAVAVGMFGFAFVCTALAYVTRRQIEARDWSMREALRWTSGNAGTAFVYPVVVLMPSIVAGGLLWLLGLVRNTGTGMASMLRIAYFVPMLLALVAVLGGLVYQLASMFVPAAAVMEGVGLAGSVSAAWTHVRRQWGRIVLHWLIVTVATGVIAIVCAALALLTFQLPDWMFGDPGEVDVRAAWRGNFLPLQNFYLGVAMALGMVLPASLFATLGTLSYASLRVAAAGQISPTPPDETSGPGMAPDRSPSPSLMEATQPAETRPGSADATSSGK
jgi:hypothetical protein